jgi:Protein of unknown function (DUF2794)
MAAIVRLSRYKRKSTPVCFNRQELNQLLSLYSRRVIGGLWKDYAIGHGDGWAHFAVFGAPSDGPLYTVIKYTPGNHRGGEFVLYRARRRIKRAATLVSLLASFEVELRLVSS